MGCLSYLRLALYWQLTVCWLMVPQPGLFCLSSVLGLVRVQLVSRFRFGYLALAMLLVLHYKIYFGLSVQFSFIVSDTLTFAYSSQIFFFIFFKLTPIFY